MHVSVVKEQIKETAPRDHPSQPLRDADNIHHQRNNPFCAFKNMNLSEPKNIVNKFLKIIFKYL